MNETVSKAIDFLRFPLAVGVVAIHCNHYGFTLSTAYTSAIVPVFMMISGLLLYRGGYFPHLYKKAIENKFYSLFIPYVLWNIIAIPIVYQAPLFEALRTEDLLSGLLGFLHSLNLFDIFIGKPALGTYFCADGPLWFIRELMTFVVLSPLLYWLIKKTHGLILIVLLALAIANITDLPNMKLLFFFSVGMCLTKLMENPNMELAKICAPLAIVIPVVKVFIVNSYVSILFSYVYPIICFWGYLGIYNSLAKRFDVGKIVALKKYTFIIYALHFAFVPVVTRHSINLLFNNTGLWPLQLLQYITEISVTVTLCIAFYLILNRVMPKCLQLLNGTIKKKR